jgi:ELP3 family radical SAM enzyme/protein acetyltransferase
MSNCSVNLTDIESISHNSSVETLSEKKLHVYESPPVEQLKSYVTDLVNLVNEKQHATRSSGWWRLWDSSGELIKNHIDDISNIVRIKYRIAPSKSDIRRTYESHLSHVTVPPIFRKWLVKRATRADSGVLVVTITLSPHKFSCKYDCFYCPQETDLSGTPTQPRSYLSTEPAMLRAIGTRVSTQSYDFDVMSQFKNRVNAYKFNGSIRGGADKRSEAKKIEVILSGGTWHSYPKSYRDQVINELYWTANTINSQRPIKSLREEILENETAEYRIIGLTGETRPDNVTEENIIEALDHGFTRWQLGEQSDDDAILKLINRKCYVKDTIRAHRLLKQAGFKIVAHLMPDLPGSSPEKDIAMFQNYLTNPQLQFDDVKIYPTAVCMTASPDRLVKSKIADWYKTGRYTPYAETNISDLIDAIVYYKVRVPPWVRIQRIVRDIPGKSIEAGYNKISNLRQVIHAEMKSRGLVCNCIYCKEIGDNELNTDLIPILAVREYKASDGTEYHISYEAHSMSMAQKIYYYIDRSLAITQWLITGRYRYWSGNLATYTGLYGFCRLRNDPSPGGTFIPEINNCALIREVHVYGFSLGVGTNETNGAQHRGHGKRLVAVAEEIAVSLGYNKIAIIAGVGTREYYKNKCGYYSGINYMLKNLTTQSKYDNIRFGLLATTISVAIAGIIYSRR